MGFRFKAQQISHPIVFNVCLGEKAIYKHTALNWTIVKRLGRHDRAKWTNKGHKKESCTLPKAQKQQNRDITKIDLPLNCIMLIWTSQLSVIAYPTTQKIINLPSDSNDKSRSILLTADRTLRIGAPAGNSLPGLADQRGRYT